MIDISGYKKTDVLRVLYDNSRPLGMGHLHYTPQPLTEQEAEEYLAVSPRFDYLRGRVMKVSLDKDTLDPRLYDRDNGQGAAARAIATLARR